MRDTVHASNARSIAVVRARLPYTDRRALSQAWFSALGLRRAETQRIAPACAQPGSGPAATVKKAPQPAASEAAGASAKGTAARRAGAAAGRAATPAATEQKSAPASEKKPPRPAGSEPAQRAVRYPPVHAAFRLELDGGRVHVVVRREGALLHVVALCNERHVERVRRALGLAAEHLRLRGEDLAAEVRAFPRTEGAA